MIHYLCAVLFTVRTDLTCQLGFPHVEHISFHIWRMTVNVTVIFYYFRLYFVSFQTAVGLLLK